MPRQNEQVNETWICDKGRFAYHFTESKERLEKPSVGKQEASWEDVLNTVASKLGEAKKDTVVLASGRLSNEDLFNLKSLADGLGGKAVLYTDMGGGNLVMQVGVGQGTNFSDIGSGDAILVVASDLYEEAPIWWLRVKQAADRGATLIVANPRETKLDKHASFVVRYANGDEVKTVQDLGGDSKIAEAFAKAENAIALFGSDGLGLAGSSSLAAACANLLVKTGHTGKANNGLIGVWPRANDQGAWEMGFRPEADLAAALKGKVVYIAGADPAGDSPALEQALKEAEFVVVQDLFQTKTADLADVVLPAQAYTERGGTMSTGERRVQRYYPAIPPLGETKADFTITAEIAKKLDIELESSSPALAFEKLAASVKDFAGLSYAKLAEVEEQWPIVGRGDLYYGGTTYENTQGLGVGLVSAAERGETVDIPEVQKEAALRPGSGQGLRPKEDELLAVPVTKLYDRGTTVAPAELLTERIGETTIALHPDAVKKLGLDAGATVQVSFDDVKGEAIVKIDETISAGVALIPRSMGLAIREPVAIKVK
jgi:NADH-quinone oxidoreductase subunit G